MLFQEFTVARNEKVCNSAQLTGRQMSTSVAIAYLMYVLTCFPMQGSLPGDIANVSIV